MYNSEIGKFYEAMLKCRAENGWVDCLVENIMNDLRYCIDVEEQVLPISAMLHNSKIPQDMSDEDVEKVLVALRQKGVVAKKVVGEYQDFFTITDFT